MICCDFCKEWFHQHCVIVPGPSDVWNKDDCSWKCSVGKRYYYCYYCFTAGIAEGLLQDKAAWCNMEEYKVAVAIERQ